ncbi:hypothetical protein AAFF_G00046010 [Aldrovandia affinis]|uniref:Uncharacterized protein n=1 Tax=Aldrovandia affinis TaxID=143900 RepID=A0AAD7S1T4_9TELE|nr:hypothetical protein AAFF_G00046010 [Aldrovandia affinis]
MFTLVEEENLITAFMCEKHMENSNHKGVVIELLKEIDSPPTLAEGPLFPNALQPPHARPPSDRHPTILPLPSHHPQISPFPISK